LDLTHSRNKNQKVCAKFENSLLRTVNGVLGFYGIFLATMISFVVQPFSLDNHRHQKSQSIIAISDRVFQSIENGCKKSDDYSALFLSLFILFFFYFFRSIFFRKR